MRKQIVLILAGFSAFFVGLTAIAQPRGQGDFEPNRGQPIGNEASASGEGVFMRTPLLAGNGCPPGTASVVLSPDKKSLSIIFDSFVAEVGGEGPRRTNKNCQLNIPFNVPSERQMAVIRLDYRGFNFLPDNATAELQASYKYTGSGSPIRGAPIRRSQRFVGPVNDLYDLTSEIEAPLWSECGRNFNLVSHTRLSAATNRQNESALSTVDSVDATVDTRVVYHLTWRECETERRGRGRGRPR